MATEVWLALLMNSWEKAKCFLPQVFPIGIKAGRYCGRTCRETLHKFKTH